MVGGDLGRSSPPDHPKNKKKGEGLSSVLRVVALRPLSWCPSACSLSSSSFFFCLSVCLSVRLSPCLSVCRRRQDLSRPVRFPDDALLSQGVSLQESWPRVQAWLDGLLRQAVGEALAAYCKPIPQLFFCYSRAVGSKSIQAISSAFLPCSRVLRWAVRDPP